MNAKDFLFSIFPKIVGFKLAYHSITQPAGPITLTFSVTNACQSRCKTCKIWKIYPEKIQDQKNELGTDEIEKIFRSMGPVYFFNLSGGEPFLRKDLPEIVDLAVQYLKPRIIHSPTNGIATNRILKRTRDILEGIRKRGLDTPLTIKPSIDGVGDLHDEIRGYRGNWKRLLATIKGLKELEREYSNLHLELGTVVSNFNKDRLDEIEDFVHSLGIQSYRNEIAEQREEFFNVGEPITPQGGEYADLMRGFSSKIRKSMRDKKPLAKVTESLRLVYYDLATRIITENRQVIPCYAGISNVHLTPHGDLWPCCVIGYSHSMGNLRDSNYDFQRIWKSARASRVRKFIKDGKCACPLANQAYSNIICDFPSLAKALLNIIRF